MKGFKVRRTPTTRLILATALLMLAAAGCEDKPISISYAHPAEYEIPANVQRVAIAEFGGETSEDKKFGNIAADMLASELDAYNRKYERYVLVDRKRLEAILGEQDMQLAISDTGSAAKVGKIANVEAMIYGSVTVSTKDEQASRMTIDFSTRRPKRVSYNKRYCMASVNFTMDDIRTSKTLATLTLTEEYDSDSDQSGVGKALGFGGDDLPPADQIFNHLIQACVKKFVRKISPHEVTITEKMEKGKSETVVTGNKLARAGDYDEATACYQRALQTHPDDDGAMFNLGLMYEAKGMLDEAEEFYTKAFAIKDSEKYVQARKRVRLEVGQ